MTDTPTHRRTAGIAPFGLRMQPDLKERIEAEALANGRSLNAEIVWRLEESLKEKGKGLTFHKGRKSTTVKSEDSTRIDHLEEEMKRLWLRFDELRASPANPPER